MVTAAPPANSIAATVGQLTVYIGADEALLVGPPEPGPLTELAHDSEAIRQWARFDALGRYRPLPGALTLRGGWVARFSDLRTLDAAIDAVYPLATVHAAEAADGTLRTVSLDAVLGRQTGRYAITRDLGAENRLLAAAVLCGECAKTPLWSFEDDAPGLSASAAPDCALPCPEPCSVLVSLCRETVIWEADPPARTPIDPAVAFAAFDVPGNAIRENLLSALEATPRDQ